MMVQMKKTSLWAKISAAKKCRAVLALLLGPLFLVMMVPSGLKANEIDTVAEFAYAKDLTTGRVLINKNADMAMKPASMAKIMTLYITFERLAEGSLTLDDTFLVSTKAWKKGGSRSFLEVDSDVDIKTLVLGVAVQSGNDAAIVLAEGLAGSEEAFATEMNRTAKKLGMVNTNFTNSTGWPDPELTTTARDLAILTEALHRDFPVSKYPDLYPVFAIKEVTINNIKQGNRNPLLYGTDGADGLKTGHTKESGYGLVGSALRDDQRIMFVLNGMKSKGERARESRRLMDFLFREYSVYKLFDTGETVEQAPVWLGKSAQVPMVLAEPLARTFSRRERADMKVSVQYSSPVPAPIMKGDQIGTLKLEAGGKTEEFPLLAGRSVAQLGLFDRIGEALKFLILGAPVALD